LTIQKRCGFKPIIKPCVKEGRGSKRDSLKRRRVVEWVRSNSSAPRYKGKAGVGGVPMKKNAGEVKVNRPGEFLAKFETKWKALE